MKKTTYNVCFFNLTNNDKLQNLECGSRVLPKMVYET